MIALSSLLSSRSSCLRGSLKKDVGKLEGVRSLFGELKGCDHCLGSWGDAIALSLCLCGSLKKDVGKLEGMRSLFGEVGGSAIAVWGG